VVVVGGGGDKSVQNYKNHSTQDSRVVPHRGTNWAVLWLTLQIGRDAVLSESYGRGYSISHIATYKGKTTAPSSHKNRPTLK
jgi:hypothetical protein